MRIASLMPSATEILFAIGAGRDVVGVTHECDYPPAVMALPRLTSSAIGHEGRTCADIDRHIRRAVHAGSSLYRLDERLLGKLRPDLIVTQELCAVCAVSYQTVARAACRLAGDVPVLSLESATLDGIMATVVATGAATGLEREAGRLVAGMRARIDAVGSLAAPAARPRVACLEWTSPTMAGGHWVPELVRLAGGDDPLGEVGEPSRAVGCDEIAAAAPDIVVFMPCGFHLARTREVTAEVTEHPGFGQLPAARTGRVAAVDGSSYFSRPGPRIVGGLEILAAIIRAEPGGPLPAGAAWVPLAQCSGPRPGALGTGDLPGARHRAEPAGG
jgi:iron complex transport system substrate-binding protein